MLDHSIAAIGIIIEDFKRWSRIFKIVFSIFTLFYLSYSLIMQNGIIYVNIALSVLYIAYTLLELLPEKKIVKKIKKIVGKSYKITALSIKAFTLGTVIYGIYMGTKNVDTISIILTTLMIILWVLQVLLEIIIFVIEPRVKLIIAGVIYDTKPIVSTINFFKKDTFVVDYEEYKKELDILRERVTEKKAANKKAATPANLFRLPQINLFKKKEAQLPKIEDKKK